MNDHRHIGLYYGASTVAVLLWSASLVATKIAYLSFSPLQLAAGRALLAAVLFGIIRTLQPVRLSISGKDKKTVLLSGALGVTLYFALQNVGVSMTSASNAALIIASYPAITTLLEYVFYRVEPGPLKIVGIATAILGVAILSQASLSSGTNSFLGGIILIGAGVVWTLYNFLTRDIVQRYDGVTLTYYQMASGTLFFIPLLAIDGFMPQPLTGGALGAFLYLALGCSFAAFLLYNLGLRRLTASASVSLMNLVPVFGVLFSYLILKEPIHPSQILGGVIVGLGVAMTTLSKTPAKA